MIVLVIDIIDMKSKIVKRIPYYAYFAMIDMFGREVYYTKYRVYIIEDGLIYSSIKTRFEKDFCL